MRRGRWLWLLALLAVPSAAHEKGVHKSVILSSSATGLQALITLEVDSGEKMALLRKSMDRDGDGLLDADEAEQLKGRLAKLAIRPLEVSAGGYPLRWRTAEAKLSLRGDRRAADGGLSLAVLLTSEYPGKVPASLELQIQDESPDGSPVRLKVVATERDGGAGQVAEREVVRGETTRVRL